MDIDLLLVVIVIIVFLLYSILKKGLILRLKLHCLAIGILWKSHKLTQSLNSHNTPKAKLEKAQKVVEELRAGFWVNRLGDKIHLSVRDIKGGDEVYGRLDYINIAIEAGFTYKQIGTTKEEVIGFRNGEAHKTSALLQLEFSRKFEKSSQDCEIEELAKDAGFTLEDIGTSEKEFEALDREYLRRLEVYFVDDFRRWATGESDSHEDPDKFEERITEALSSEEYSGGFTYEELGTSEKEYAEMMRLARRREVVRWIGYLKSEAKQGVTDTSFAREQINESLEKADLTLNDYDMTEADLDEIERSAYIVKAKNSLDELRKPGEGWFFSEPSPANPNARFYLPVILKCIPGDPYVFVKEIKKNLSKANATLDDIGTTDFELKSLVRAGHLASAEFLLSELKKVAETPRRTMYEKMSIIIGPNAMIMEDPKNPIDREELEAPYPIERDLEAIEYHLRFAGIELKDVGGSKNKLRNLKLKIEAR